MTIRLADRGIRAVLLDIEGTTTPIAFVHDELFPYARARLATWWAQSKGSTEARDLAHALAAEHAEDVRRGEALAAWPAGGPDEPGLVDYLRWLMDRDRKSPALKRLQGWIWERGYQAGELRGRVYADVPIALRRWSAHGVSTAIYSSGSELAQRRLFESTEGGDLTPLLDGFFDTRVGPKQDPASYRHILVALGRPPSCVVFVSDVTAELRAAREAGCQTLLSLRPGNAIQPNADRFEAIHTLDELQ